jgi:hypothetical protein
MEISLILPFVFSFFVGMIACIALQALVCDLQSMRLAREYGVGAPSKVPKKNSVICLVSGSLALALACVGIDQMTTWWETEVFEKIEQFGFAQFSDSIFGAPGVPTGLVLTVCGLVGVIFGCICYRPQIWYRPRSEDLALLQ